MRLILRNFISCPQSVTYQRYSFTQTRNPHSAPPEPSPQFQITNISPQTLTLLQGEEQPPAAAYQRRQEREKIGDDWKLEGPWKYAAPALMAEHYSLLEPVNREQLARKQLEKYEQVLGLDMQEHLHSKIYMEQGYFKRVAKHHLTEMGPLTPAFLERGYNFLNKKLLLHLIRNSRIQTLKQMLVGGALESADYIDQEVIVAVMVHYDNDRRNLFMLNLLSYQHELVAGSLPGDIAFTLQQEVINSVEEDTLLSILYDINGSREINKLRLLWSFQRLYLNQYNLIEYILSELKKIKIETGNPATQGLVNKEVSSLLNRAYDSDIFADFYFKVVEQTKTYNNFVKAWPLILLIFSKLDAIPRVITTSHQNQLHPIFALVELNLPKEIADVLLRETVFNFLIYEQHSRIQFQNYQRCLDHWMKDYTQPSQTHYHSILTKTAETLEEIHISYQQVDNAQPYATTSLTLRKNKLNAVQQPKTQTDTIYSLLKGDYQAVFNDFLVRYSLPSDFDRKTKFHKKLAQMDRQLSFKSKDEEALYKLKEVTKFFFLQTYPKVLDEECLQPFKKNLTVVKTLDHQVLRGKQILSNRELEELEEVGKEYDEYMQALLFQGEGEEAQEQVDLQDYVNPSIQKPAASKEVAKHEEIPTSKQIQKQLQILTILGDNVSMQQLLYLPLETAQILRELQRKKLIDKNFFKELKTMPLNKAQARVEEFLAKYSENLRKQTLQLNNQVLQAEQHQENILNAKQLIAEQQHQKRTGQKGQIQKSLSVLTQIYKYLEHPDLVKAQERALEDEEQQGQIQEQIQQELQNQNFSFRSKKPITTIQTSPTIQDYKKYLGITDEEIDQHDKLVEGTLDAEYDFRPTRIEQQSPAQLQDLFKDQQQSQFSTEIDGARVDRAILFAFDHREVAQQVPDLYQNANWAAQSKTLMQPVEIEGTEQGGSQERNELERRISNDSLQRYNTQNTQRMEIESAVDQIEDILLVAFESQQDVQIDEAFTQIITSIYIKQVHSDLNAQQIEGQEFQTEEFKQIAAEKQEDQDQDQQYNDSHSDTRDWKRGDGSYNRSPFNSNRGEEQYNNRSFRSNSQYHQQSSRQLQQTHQQQPIQWTHRQAPADRGSFFKRKNKHQFCTAKPQSDNVPASHALDLQKIQTYRREEISRDFLTLMQSQTHIPRVGSGSTIAKYLFLHGTRPDKKGPIDPSRQMTIQFTSVVGTRTKSYQKYIRSSLYSYELEDSLYLSLLQDQLAVYNRNQFKLIVAHLIHYKKSLSDGIVELICSISEQQRIGYSFVEIAQFIKANSISISPQALQTVTKTWQKFDIINEDLLPFVREYCRKVGLQFATPYYSHLCTSLIKTKRWQKLEALCVAVLAEIRPKPFKVQSSMVAHQVPALQKAWKAKEQQSYVRLYLQLIEAVVVNLDLRVPLFLGELYEEYIKLRTSLDEKELGYGMVCYSLKKPKFQQLLNYLEKNPALGTSFMYDCTLQALLSNFDELQDQAEKILDLSVIVNRIALSTQQIMRSMVVFKKSTTSNAFSKFLEHCLRFQVDIDKQPQIKREMFYVLNNNVEEVSVAGVFNLLDFIFSEKRSKERKQYRQIKLSEEEKERKLLEIQQSKSVKTSSVTADKAKPGEEKKGKKKKEENVSEAIEGQSSAKKAEQKLEQSTNKAESNISNKKQQKRAKKQRTVKKKKQVQLLQQILSQQAAVPQQSSQMKSSQTDEQIIGMVKSQSKKHESAKRKGVQSFGLLYESQLQTLNAQEAANKEKEEKGNVQGEAKGGKAGKGGKGGKGGGKGKK